MLFKLDIQFEIFQGSFEHHIANKASSTQHEFALIQKMQMKSRQEDMKQLMAELGDKLLTRDEALKIFEQLQKLESDVRKDVSEELGISDADFAKLNEDGSVSEALQELQYKQDVAEA